MKKKKILSIFFALCLFAALLFSSLSQCVELFAQLARFCVLLASFHLFALASLLLFFPALFFNLAAFSFLLLAFTFFQKIRAGCFAFGIPVRPAVRIKRCISPAQKLSKKLVSFCG